MEITIFTDSIIKSVNEFTVITNCYSNSFLTVKVYDGCCFISNLFEINTKSPRFYFLL